MIPKNKILHVEDNLENRLLIRRLLQSRGYEIQEAENASKALMTLSTFQPDLILMDMNMPDVDGYTLTTQIKNNPSLSSIKIIAITANVMRGDREKTIQAGCDGYIEKPIDVDLFLDQIQEFMQ